MNTAPQNKHEWLQRGEMPGSGAATAMMALESADHRLLTSHMLGDDGTWHAFLTVSDRRRS